MILPPPAAAALSRVVREPRPLCLQQHEALKSFVTQMQQVARELRIEFSPPKIFITKGGSQKPADYEAVIRSEVSHPILQHWVHRAWAHTVRVQGTCGAHWSHTQPCPLF